jgi:hypothetical protein
MQRRLWSLNALTATKVPATMKKKNTLATFFKLT